jgi:glucan phosphoethanolaminetransferase (alkaline phosphatase superfamily)
MQGDSTAAITRSWTLTQGSVLRLQMIYFVAFLITIPLSLVVNLVVAFLPQDNPITFLISLALSILMGALLIPFWQAIKAVIYYDLRTQKEGIDLEIRDA